MAFQSLLENYVKTPWWQIFQCSFFSNVISPVQVESGKLKFMGLRWKRVSKDEKDEYKFSTKNKDLIERIKFNITKKFSIFESLVIPLLIDEDTNSLMYFDHEDDNKNLVVFGDIPYIDLFIKKLAEMIGMPSENIKHYVSGSSKHIPKNWPKETETFGYLTTKFSILKKSNITFCVQAFCSIFLTEFSKKRFELIAEIVKKDPEENMKKKAEEKLQKKLSLDVFTNHVADFLRGNVDTAEKRQKFVHDFNGSEIIETFKYGKRTSVDDQPAIFADIG